MKRVFLILGNQLFPHKHLRKYKDSTIFMCESFDLCTFQKHHKLKLILFLSSMRSYACLLYTSPSPRDLSTSRMPSSA